MMPKINDVDNKNFFFRFLLVNIYITTIMKFSFSHILLIFATTEYQYTFLLQLPTETIISAF